MAAEVSDDPEEDEVCLDEFIKPFTFLTHFFLLFFEGVLWREHDSTGVSTSASGKRVWKAGLEAMIAAGVDNALGNLAIQDIEDEADWRHKVRPNHWWMAPCANPYL